MNKQLVIDSILRLVMELNREKKFSEEFAHEPDCEYYLLAELYRTLDQYCIDNNRVICKADRWI